MIVYYIIAGRLHASVVYIEIKYSSKSSLGAGGAARQNYFGRASTPSLSPTQVQANRLTGIVRWACKGIIQYDTM